MLKKYFDGKVSVRRPHTCPPQRFLSKCLVLEFTESKSAPVATLRMVKQQ
jgi:hypothetical protein